MLMVFITAQTCAWGRNTTQEGAKGVKNEPPTKQRPHDGHQNYHTALDT